MTIILKYNKGDFVFFMHNNSIHKGKIILMYNSPYNEKQLFSTKEALINQL